jgi:subtilisin-like proprotein convertase family protein
MTPDSHRLSCKDSVWIELFARKIRFHVLLLVVFSLIPSERTFAQRSTNSTNYLVNSSIPDNDASGLSSTVTFASPQISLIEDVNVTLNISGGFNGDLYTYLTHSSGFTVLLNRVGRTTGNGLGYADAGFNVTLDDSASNNDIHSYRLVTNPQGSALTGTWSPDARNVDPSASLDSSPRSAFLGSFSGLDPNGTWTLFVADVSLGGISTFDSWGLQVVGVPEPSILVFTVVGSLALLLSARRSKRAI